MSGNNETFSWKFYFLVILALGAFMGLAEALLGGLARDVGLPRSPVVTAAGFAVMAAGLAVFKQARIIPGIVLMAVFAKWLATPLLGLPVFCQANSHLAVLLNGAFLFAGVSLARKKIAGNGRMQGVVAPCAHLLSFRFAGGAAGYMLTRVAPAALLGAVLFPLGYALGRKLEKRLLPLWLARKPLFAPLAVACALACWGLTVGLIAAGR
jgi:hypothetical protein